MLQIFIREKISPPTLMRVVEKNGEFSSTYWLKK